LKKGTFSFSGFNNRVKMRPEKVDVPFFNGLLSAECGLRGTSAQSAIVLGGAVGVNGWLMQCGEWLYSILTSKVALLTLGGAFGTNARYFLGKWIDDTAGSQDFPLGTFVINISGSLAVALAAFVFRSELTQTGERWFLLMGTGICGGYTTFSAFELQTFELIDRGKWPIAVAYVASSLLAGFLAVAIVFWTFRPEP
jgi:CrcB protein